MIASKKARKHKKINQLCLLYKDELAVNIYRQVFDSFKFMYIHKVSWLTSAWVIIIIIKDKSVNSVIQGQKKA